MSRLSQPDPPATNGHSQAKKDLDDRKAAFLFNSFHLVADPISGELVVEGIPKPRHVALLKSEQNLIIHTLKGHQSGSLEKTKKEFRKGNKGGYRYETKWTFKTAASGEDRLFRYKLHKPTGVAKTILAVPIEEMFDIILDVHEDVGHLKLAKTKNALDEKFYGIPRDVVEHFIALCPVCSTDQPKTSPHKGAVLPISSYSFCDHF